MKSTPISGAIVALAAVAALAGCGGSPTVKQSDVEAKVSAALEKQVGQKPDDISCPGDLEGKVGTKMRCTLTAGDTQYGVSLEVNKVDGKKVNFGIKVDDEPKDGTAS